MYRGNQIYNELYIGKVEIISIYQGRLVIWESGSNANFITSDNFIINSSDKFIFNAKQQ